MALNSVANTLVEPVAGMDMWMLYYLNFELM